MMRAHPGHRRSEGDDAEETEQDDDGVEAGALPITAAKMQLLFVFSLWVALTKVSVSRSASA